MAGSLVTGCKTDVIHFSRVSPLLGTIFHLEPDLGDASKNCGGGNSRIMHHRD